MSRHVVDVEDLVAAPWSYENKKCNSVNPFAPCTNRACRGKTSTCPFGPVDVEDLANLCLFGQEIKPTTPPWQRPDVFQNFCTEERWFNCQQASKCPLYVDNVSNQAPPCYNNDLYYFPNTVNCLGCGDSIDPRGCENLDDDEWQEYLYVCNFGHLFSPIFPNLNYSI